MLGAALLCPDCSQKEKHDRRELHSFGSTIKEAFANITTPLNLIKVAHEDAAFRGLQCLRSVVLQQAVLKISLLPVRLQER